MNRAFSGKPIDLAAILDLDPEIEAWRTALGGTVRNVRIPGTRAWIDANGEPVKASGMVRPKKGQNGPQSAGKATAPIGNP